MGFLQFPSVAFRSLGELKSGFLTQRLFQDAYVAEPQGLGCVSATGEHGGGWRCLMPPKATDKRSRAADVHHES